MFGFFEPIHLKTQRRKERETETPEKNHSMFKNEALTGFPETKGPQRR